MKLWTENQEYKYQLNAKATHCIIFLIPRRTFESSFHDVAKEM